MRIFAHINSYEKIVRPLSGMSIPPLKIIIIMTKKLTFHATLANSKKMIKSLSGRLGSFIFRTLKDGRITAYYKPRKGATNKGFSRDQIVVLYRELCKIAYELQLSVTSLNVDFQ